VLKTAAICVAKLYDINAQLVEEQGFLDQLRDLVTDSNPMVVANAVAALSEIDEVASQPVFTITKQNLQKLLAALEECTEWGQVFILNALAKYQPKDSKEAETIANRVTPRLQHANSAVVLAAVKVLMQVMELIRDEAAILQLCQKMSPPLVTLLSKEPEIQYVALRNINLIIQKQPLILQNEMKVFFCKYNDPIYVKMEKLEIMIMLVNEKSIDQVLLEFKEYAQEVDVEFVRKSVRAIGRCAIKLDKAPEKCVHVLLDLIKTKVNYVVQEAVIVIKDIFRRYPNRYESVISALCENLDSLDEPEAKASMIWIVGEYAERIDNADELLQSFLESFKDESPQVQLQLLTAVVKLFLKRPKVAQNMVQDTLNMATQESDNPDLRDRGYLYWRLLSTDPEAAKQVVLAQKPLISEHTERIDPTVLRELISNISTLASVYHKPPETFVPKLKGVKRGGVRRPVEQDDYEEDGDVGGTNGSGLIDMGDVGSALPSGGSPMGDLLTGFGAAPAPTPAAAPAASSAQSQQKPTPKVQVLQASPQSGGVDVRAGFVRRNGQLFLDVTLTNEGQVPLNQFLVQIKPNIFRISPAARGIEVPQLNPGQSADAMLPLNTEGQLPQDNAISNIIAFAVKHNTATVYFNVALPAYALFVEEGAPDKTTYLNTWRSIAAEKYCDMAGLFSANVDALQARLQAYNVTFVARRKGENNTDVVYASVKLTTGVVFLLELAFAGNSCKLCTKTAQEAFIPFVEKSIQFILAP
jgi:AP-1 complex subunit beta-1